MELWKKLTAAILAGIMIFALAACTESKPEETPKSTEAPTEASEAPTSEGTPVNEENLPAVNPETFKDFIGVWYADGSSTGYRITINEIGTWELTDSSEDAAASGNLRFNDEDQILELYDPDGTVAITMLMENEGVVNVEIMLDTLAESLSTNYFYNTITGNVSDAPSAEVDDTHTDIGATDDSAVAPPPVDEEPAEEPTMN